MRWPLVISVVLLPLLWVGCGESEVATPTACLESPAKLETALVTAPEPVRIDGRIPISDCLIRNQPNGDLAKFGSDAVAVATQLGSKAGKSGPEGITSAIRVGYLVGAMEKGANNSEGIHAALVDRVKRAATNKIERADDDGAELHYKAGVEAGREFE